MIHFKLIKSRIAERIDDILNLRATRKQKPDDSYVTEGDLLVEEIVMQSIATVYPHAIVISEELKNEDVSLEASDIFVVDPIDGTENFTSGFVEWGVSIAHYQNGKHHASLLYCPEMSLSIQTGDAVVRHQSRVRGLSSSLSMEDLVNMTQGYEYRILGCCVYNMMCVIRGSFCSFENPKGASSWDILAGLNLALEHGLNVIVNDKKYTGEYLPHTTKYRFKVEG